MYVEVGDGVSDMTVAAWHTRGDNQHLGCL